MKTDTRSITCNHAEVSIFVHHDGVDFISAFKWIKISNLIIIIAKRMQDPGYSCSMQSATELTMSSASPTALTSARALILVGTFFLPAPVYSSLTVFLLHLLVLKIGLYASMLCISILFLLQFFLYNN
jgi:hypothetical protein